MLMKSRLLCLLIACAAILAAACSTAPAAESATNVVVTTESLEPTIPPSATSDPASSETNEPDLVQSHSDSIVVYFSATGNTRAIAEQISSDLNADLFEIEPLEPYTEEDLNWRDDESRTTVEHETKTEVVLVDPEVPNWGSYTHVFLGYPIWWGEAAWPAASFVAANDFSGKTIYPYCTSGSSGVGSSAEELADIAGTGDWQQGIRFPAGADSAAVQEWLTELGLEIG